MFWKITSFTHYVPSLCLVLSVPRPTNILEALNFKPSVHSTSDVLISAFFDFAFALSTITLTEVSSVLILATNTLSKVWCTMLEHDSL